MSKHRTIAIVAGEVSGDMHAAGLVRALHKKEPNTVFFGIGGTEMRAAGVETIYDISDMAVMGITEVLKKYLFFRKIFKQLLSQIEERGPDAVILVDYPGFNLRLAEETHAMGIKTIYYVCPQVWAWHRSRIKRMEEIIDRLITIFPFEKQHFKETNLRVDFAGHPLVDRIDREGGAQESITWNGDPRIAILPGSRIQEIQRILPAMWSAAWLIEKEYPDVSFILAASSKEMADVLREETEMLGGGPSRWNIVHGKTRAVLNQARAAMVASGTATVETALMRCPMVIAYRTAALTYLLGKFFVKIDNIGMVNIIAGKEICPEFIQGQVKGDVLANAMLPLLGNTPERKAMTMEIEKVIQSLGHGGADTRAAEIIIDELNR